MFGTRHTALLYQVIFCWWVSTCLLVSFQNSTLTQCSLGELIGLMSVASLCPPLSPRPFAWMALSHHRGHRASPHRLTSSGGCLSGLLSSCWPYCHWHLDNVHTSALGDRRMYLFVYMSRMWSYVWVLCRSAFTGTTVTRTSWDRLASFVEEETEAYSATYLWLHSSETGKPGTGYWLLIGAPALLPLVLVNARWNVDLQWGVSRPSEQVCASSKILGVNTNV